MTELVTFMLGIFVGFMVGQRFRITKRVVNSQSNNDEEVDE